MRVANGPQIMIGDRVWVLATPETEATGFAGLEGFVYGQTIPGTSEEGLFVFEVLKAHVAASPKYRTTLHYRGDGVFMVSGRNVSYRRRFKRVNL